MEDIFGVSYDGLSYDEMIDKCEEFAYSNMDDVALSGENIGVCAFRELVTSLLGIVAQPKYFELLKKAMNYSYMCGSYEEACEFGEKALSVIDSIDKDKIEGWNNEYANLLFKLYIPYHYKLGNIDMSYKHLVMANSFLDNLGMPDSFECENAFEIKKAYALYLRNNDRLDDALKTYNELLAYLAIPLISDQEMDVLGVAEIKALSAEILVEKQLWDAAKFSFMVAFDHFSKLNDKDEDVIAPFTRCCCEFGKLYLRTEETDNAIQMFKKAVSLIEPVRKSTTNVSILSAYSESYYNLACVYYESGESDFAVKCFRTVDETCIALLFLDKDDCYAYLAADSWASISGIEKEKGNLEMALESINISIDYAIRFIEDKDLYEEAIKTYFMDCATILSKLGKNKEALEKVDDAIALGTGNEELAALRQELIDKKECTNELPNNSQSSEQTMGKNIETKAKIVNLLKSTNRENIENVIEYMETKGFFVAPASVVNHNNFEGGLAKHSLEVCEVAMKLNEKRSEPLPQNSIILCSLLHDICKADQYFIKDGKPGRYDNMCKRGHGIRSMFILKRKCSLPLNRAEEMAIWWHMGEHEKSKCNYEKDYTESFTIDLCKLIQQADSIAAGKVRSRDCAWNALQWLADFERSKNVKDGTRETRKQVWKSTLNIVRNGEYQTESGNVVALNENPNIAEETVFYSEEIARLNPSERFDSIVSVHLGDCLEFAKFLRDADETDDLCVLNLASYRNPGGGVASGAGAQEEYLFRCSDYFRSLYQYASSFDCQKLYGITPAEEKYPLDENFGGIYSHGVTIFRDTEAKGYALLEEPWKANFVAAAVPRLEKDTRTTPRHIVPIVENTIRTILRMAYVNGQRRLVLGALGCGAFHHPPREMAMTFKRVIAEPEFAGAFKSIHFAIFDDHNAKHNGVSNVEAFKEVFEK